MAEAAAAVWRWGASGVRVGVFREPITDSVLYFGREFLSCKGVSCSKFLTPVNVWLGLSPAEVKASCVMWARGRFVRIMM